MGGAAKMELGPQGLHRTREKGGVPSNKGHPCMCASHPVPCKLSVTPRCAEWQRKSGIMWG